MIKRIVLIVLDSVGVGAMDDAEEYGDSGANTLGHILEYMGESYRLPNLGNLGLYSIIKKAPGIKPGQVSGSYGEMICASKGKDTTVGHWEIAGIISDKPFPTYPAGFPRNIIEEFEKKIGTRTLGNVTASGTEIIKRLGPEHVKTGYPIVYTSADSVFQVAAHEKIFGLEKLYSACKIARVMLTGENAVARVIARPFIGDEGNFIRTENRRDFSLSPVKTTVLDEIKEKGGNVVAIGKINDIFDGRGVTKYLAAHSNDVCMKETLASVRQSRGEKDANTLIFANLVDFDMLWGHRRDVSSYGRGLKEFDEFLPSLISALDQNDLLMITADHGCDPTYKAHTDHTREYVPLLVYGKAFEGGVDLGIRRTFSDIAQTITDFFDLKPFLRGTSFRKNLKERT